MAAQMDPQIFPGQAGPGVQGDSNSLASSLSNSGDCNDQAPPPASDTSGSSSPAISSSHASSVYSDEDHGSYRRPQQERGRRKKLSGKKPYAIGLPPTDPF